MRLTEVDRAEVLAHMSDPKVAEYLPLMISCWTEDRVVEFIAAKEAGWARDGLGHWAVLSDGAYAGWGGFEKDEGAWEFGLVLKPEAFGLGFAVVRKALAFAREDPRIEKVSFYMDPKRPSLGVFDRAGAVPVGVVEHDGERFRKFLLDTV
ncbi:MAG: GNAT family N-acetyltransferase [Silicimonas sp.]|nr:GNAT family N-acetyltransferase [Silicimonas sp.]